MTIENIVLILFTIEFGVIVFFVIYSIFDLAKFIIINEGEANK